MNDETNRPVLSERSERSSFSKCDAEAIEEEDESNGDLVPEGSFRVTRTRDGRMNVDRKAVMPPGR